MNSTQASLATRYKVGIFSALGLLLIGATTVFVNDRPYWWRSCNLKHVNVDDATGLKTKSPIRSLGLEIGYLHSVRLSEEKVRIGICITAPVEILETTRAYIRSEGFLGDKFVELKPVHYLDAAELKARGEGRSQGVPAVKDEIKTPGGANWEIPVQPEPQNSQWLNGLLWSTAYADEAKKGSAPGGQEIPVGKQSQDLANVVNQVDGLVREMTQLTSNLKEGINPKELKNTMTQLNKTLENASRTLSPEGGLNTTAQRTLAKLEEAIESLRDVMARINRGQGSIGMMINDPSYAEEIRMAIRNINKLLGKATEIRLLVDIGGDKINGYTSGRAGFKLQIFPTRDRYYLIGVSIDPRGKRSVKETTVTSGGVSTTTTTTEIEEGGLLINLMFGKIFKSRLEAAVGVLNGDGAVTGALRLGPTDREDILQLRADVYNRGKGYGLDSRYTVLMRPFSEASILSNIYLRGGIESIHKVSGALPYFGGAGVVFDDNDIKLLFAFK